jgi:hypothetical protein
LYFDQNEFFTERKFKLSDPKGTSNGQGIDFRKDFKVINSQKKLAKYNLPINIKTI